MKKTILILVIFLNIVLLSKAQIIQKVQVTISPFSFLSSNHPSLRMGFDLETNKRISFGSDFSFGNDLLVLNKQYKTDYLFYQIRPQIKYNLISTTQHSLYIGLEYYYQNRIATLHNGYFGVSNGYIHYENADYLKAKEGLNLNLGLKIYLKKHFVGEIYAGAGVFQRYTKYSNIDNGVFLYSNNSLFLFHEITGYKVNIGIDIGLKIGLWWGKKIETPKEPKKFDYDIN